MKIIAINGSPRPKGNTHTALTLVLAELDKSGFETELIDIGHQQIRGCQACGVCGKKKNRRCAIDDLVNELVDPLAAAAAIVVGSPVYFAGLNGTLKCFLDRLFYVSGSNGNLFRHKVGASVAVCRRAGSTVAVDEINKYFQYAEMILPGSFYWTGIHGGLPGECLKDEEGVHVMQTLGKNIAWLLQLIRHGQERYPAPGKDVRARTSFIRE